MIRLGQRGSAMVLVLWGLAAIAIAAGLAFTLARDQGRRAGDAVLRAQARHAADGALFRAAAGLLDPEQAKRLVPDGRVLEAQYLGASIWLQVQDEAGKIDLNTAEAPVFGRLLAMDGVPDARLPQVLAAWQNRRGELNGYRLVEQIAGLPDIDAPRLERLSGDLTVWSGSALVDPWSASPKALQAATGLVPADIQAFVLARNAAGAGRPPPLPPQFNGTPTGPSPRRLFGLRATAQMEADAPRVSRHMVVRLGSKGLEILEMR